MSTKVIVITGASEGIGAALAKSLAARGEQVVLAARREEELQQAAQACGSGALPVVTDVTKRGQVERLRDQALKAYGRVDVWVNNVGRGITRRVLDLTDQDFDEVLDANLRSALYGMQTIVPYFQQRGQGHLINISSFLGRIPFATYRSLYSASKAALNVLTASLRMDLRADYPNIYASVVMPGVVTTHFAENALYGHPLPDGARAGAQSPEEVATVIVDLIDHPRAEAYTNPAMQLERVKAYYADVETFEKNMGR